MTYKTVLYSIKEEMALFEKKFKSRKFKIDQVIFKNAEIVLRKNPGKKKYEVEFLLNSFKKNQKTHRIKCFFGGFCVKSSDFEFADGIIRCSAGMRCIFSRPKRRFGVQTVNFTDLEGRPSNSSTGLADR